jgi:single stranded DNA-binding protein
MSSIATTNETSNVTSLPTAPKPQTSKEVIAANVKLLIEQLEAGHSEGLTAYLTAMGKFHSYSFGNILEIARQMPSASRVAGLYAWNQLGRRVKKGQKGIRILAPLLGTKRKKDTEAEKDITKQNQPVLVGFRAVYVFDVSQTEGAELPDLKERVKGHVGEYRERLIDFILAQGIELEFTESTAPALGMSLSTRPRRAIMQNSSAFQFLALDTIHESATNPRRTFEDSKLHELPSSRSELPRLRCKDGCSRRRRFLRLVQWSERQRRRLPRLNTMFNKVILIGRLGQNAEAKTAQNNKEYVVLNIATQESWKNDKGEYETRTEWHRVFAWSNLWKFAKTLQKGQRITLEGTLRYREVEDEVEGTRFKHRIAEVHATSMKRLSKVEAADDPSDGADDE